MSDERDNLFEEEAEYEAIFRSLREKYNLDNEPKEEQEEPREFYNPEEDTELSDFFEEKSKLAQEKADEYMYDEEDLPEIEEETPVEELKVEDFDSDAKTEAPKAAQEQTYEDFEWDENTVLDFSTAENKEKVQTPTVFEDISSNKTPDEIENDNKLSLDSIKQNQTISIEETVQGVDDSDGIPFVEPEEEKVFDADDPASVILPQYNVEPKKDDSFFTIKTDDIETLTSQGDDFDFVSEDEAQAADAEENTGIMKEVTYENINWEDFPTPRQHRREVKKQKKAEKKKGRHGIFPRKGDSAGEVIRKIVLIISVIAIIASSGWLVNDLVVQPSLANKLYGGILDGIITTDDDRHITSFDDMTDEERAQATKELLSQNGDYVGWLTVKGADVSLPVVMAGSNEKYLHTGFDGKWLNAGTLFVSSSNRSVLDKNVVIYGHNMNNGSMFGLLRKYKESDGSIYRDYPYITFHTIEGSFKYEIYGAFLADGAGKSDGYFINTAIKPNFSDEAFLNYMTSVRQKAYYQTSGTVVKPDDRILTLVTCDRSNLSTGRLVLVAKLIEEL